MTTGREQDPPPRVPEVERHYSVASVAEILEVSKPWVYDRIKSGELSVVELGDSKAKQRIAASILQRYLDGRTHPARQQRAPRE